MRRLLFLALVLAGCGGEPVPAMTPPLAATPTVQTTASPTPTPAPTSDDKAVREMIAALDRLQMFVNEGASDDATGIWALDTVRTLKATAAGTLDPRLSTFADDLAALLAALADGSDTTAAVRTLLAQRAVLTDLLWATPAP